MRNQFKKVYLLCFAQVSKILQIVNRCLVFYLRKHIDLSIPNMDPFHADSGLDTGIYLQIVAGYS
jgi:hypothetical protein